MKNFFSLYVTYSKYIFKFWVTQISMSAFGLLVSMASIATISNPTDSKWMVICSAVFAIGFLSFLLYDMMFMRGLNDSPLLKKYDNNEKPNIWLGLKIALLSYAPTILITLIAIIFYIIDIKPVYIVSKSILLFVIHGTYNGFFWLLSDTIPEVMILILSLFPAIISCTLGYYLGLKDLPIRKILGIPIKPPKPPKNK